MDIQTLFDKAGGATRLGLLIGVARTTVIGWKQTGIPGNRVVQIGSALNIPSDELLKLVQPPRKRSKRLLSSEATPDAAPESSPPPSRDKAA
jgi:hypothetical protein